LLTHPSVVIGDGRVGAGQAGQVTNRAVKYSHLPSALVQVSDINYGLYAVHEPNLGNHLSLEKIRAQLTCKTNVYAHSKLNDFEVPDT
jgi:hypothetical protein